MSDAIHPVVVPKWGLSMTEGTLTEWNIKTGASVQPGDIIAQIETDKIVNELEVHEGGILRRQLVVEGETIPVGGLLGVVAAAEVPEEAIDAFVRNFAGGDTEGLPVGDPRDSASSEFPGETMVFGSGHGRPSLRGTAIPADLVLAEGVNNPTNANATHLARQLSNRWRIDLTKIEGSGRRGRISRTDVRKGVSAAGGWLGEYPVSPAQNVSENVEHYHTPVKTFASSGAWEEIPLSNRRRVIARRLSQAKRDAPHFRVSVDVQVDELMKLREQTNRDNSECRVTLNDMLIKAVAVALVRLPVLNVQYDGEVLRQFVDVDIAVAVALDDGLITPIVRQANRKSLAEISRVNVDLIARAKSGKLRPEEIEGGTFTVSNLGMFGVSAFDAIINPPQVAILSVGAVTKKRMFVGDEEIVAMVMKTTLSSDHRIVDGVLSARFMQLLKQIIEQPVQYLN